MNVIPSKSSRRRFPSDHWNNYLSVSCALAFLFLTVIGAVPALATTNVGDPNNPGALPQAVLNAYNAGERNIVINPGTYIIPSGSQSTFNLVNWSNATISAYNVTIIASDQTWGHWLFNLDHCNNVSILGANLSQTTMTAYQGRIVAKGTNSNGHNYVNWQPDAGFPVPASPTTTIDTIFVDGSTHYIRSGTWDWWGATHTALGSNTFQMDLGSTIVAANVGDVVVGRYGNAPFKISLWVCTNCTIQDVTMSRNGFSPIREDGIGGGGNHILNVTWTPGARPAGATQDPLVSGAADGLHSTFANPGPDIEYCAFQGVILDDCIAIHGGLQSVTAVSGNTITVDGTGNGLAAGNPVRIGSTNGFYADANCTALNGNTLTLDRTLSIPVGAKVSNPLRNGPGYKILNCQIGGTRSRGILVKADNGLIQGNLIAHCGMSGISSGPEYYWNEGDYAHNVTIQRNLFLGNGLEVNGNPMVWIHGEGAQGNQQITIRDNTFAGSIDADEMRVEWTSGATVTGNSATGNFYTSAVVSVNNSTGVTLSNNAVQNAAVYSALVYVGAGVTNLSGNNSSGIRGITTTVQNGLYKIVELQTGQCMDAYGANTANGTSIIQYPYNGSDNQEWIVTALDTNRYRIQGLESGRVLDIPGGSGSNGAMLELWDWNGGNNQQFSLAPASAGNFTITCQASSKLLEVAGSSTTAAAAIDQWAATGATNQQWSFQSIGGLQNGGVYEVEPQCAPGSCLDVSGAATTDAANVAIWTFAGAANQKWRAIDDGSGYWEFEPQQALGKRLDVYNAGSADGTNVDQYTANGANAQKWLLYNNGDNSFSLAPQCAPGSRLDVSGGGSANGTNVQIWTSNGTSAQRWKFYAH